MPPLILGTLIGAGTQLIMQALGFGAGSFQQRQEMEYNKEMAEWNNALARENYDYQYKRESAPVMYNQYREFLSPSAAAQAAGGITPNASLSFAPAAQPSSISSTLAQMVGGSFNNIPSALSSFLPNMLGTPQSEELQKKIDQIAKQNDLTAEQIKQAQLLTTKLLTVYAEDASQAKIITDKMRIELRQASFQLNKIRSEASKAEADAEIANWKKDTMKKFGFLPDMDVKSMLINMILQGKSQAAIDTLQATFEEFMTFGKKKFREWW